MKTLFAILMSILLTMMSVSAAPGMQNQRSDDAPVILSDTQGYNFESYLTEATSRIRQRWYERIPETARQKRAGGKVAIAFTILRDGSVQNIRVTTSSSSPALIQAAIAAVQASSPFASLPSDFRGDRIVVQFSFSYNVR